MRGLKYYLIKNKADQEQLLHLFPTRLQRPHRNIIERQYCPPERETASAATLSPLAMTFPVGAGGHRSVHLVEVGTEGQVELRHQFLPTLAVDQTGALLHMCAAGEVLETDGVGGETVGLHNRKGLSAGLPGRAIR